MKKFGLSIVLAAALALSGCADAAEIEERGFVIALGIDKAEENGDFGERRFLVSALLPDVAGIVNGNGDKSAVIISEGETLTTAMQSADKQSSKTLYYGHIKAVVFGSGVLSEPEMMKEAADALERNRTLGRRILVLATDGNAADVMASEPKTEPLVGIYITNHYKNNSNAVNATIEQTFERFIANLRANGNTFLPVITTVNSGETSEPQIGGACVVSNFKLAGWLDENRTRGILWIRGQGEGTILHAEITADEFRDSTRAAFEVTKSGGKVRFDENETGDGLVCTINITARGSIAEYSLLDESVSGGDMLQMLENKYQNIIADDVISLVDCLHGEFKTDALLFRETLRKFNWNLYNKYAKSDYEWEKTFENIEIELFVDVRIINTGAVK